MQYILKYPYLSGCDLAKNYVSITAYDLNTNVRIFAMNDLGFTNVVESGSFETLSRPQSNNKFCPPNHVQAGCICLRPDYKCYRKLCLMMSSCGMSLYIRHRLNCNIFLTTEY